MDCSACEELLRAYLDRELSADERASVEEHLGGCEACRAALDEFGKVDGILRRIYGRRELSEEARKRTTSAVTAAERSGDVEEPDRAHMRIGGYEILAKLGEGGMGAVYKARQLSMQRFVALKILRPVFARDAEFLQRFVREARASAKLNHPNIMQGIDVGQDGDHHYFAMEYVEGLPVGKILSREGPMPEKRALDMVAQIAKGLEHAWKHNIIHRDIKPENIMITAKGEAKLCDLGLARGTGQDAAITQTGSIVGTPHYISPEQARGETRIDTRSDIYSLGVTLYNMLTGEAPFDGDTSAVVMAKHINEPVPDPRRLRAELSPAVAALVATMMAKSPPDRPADPTVLLEQIDLVLRGQMPTRTAPSPSPMPARARGPKPGSATVRRRSRDLPVRRGSAAVLYIGIAAAAAAIMVAAMLFLGGPKEPRTRRAPPKQARGAPGDELPKGPSAVEKRLQEALGYAMKKASDEPANYSANIERLRRFMKEAGSTPLAQTAADKLKEIEDERQRAADVFLAKLCDEADRRYGDGKVAEAFELIRSPELPPELAGASVTDAVAAKRADLVRRSTESFQAALSAVNDIRPAELPAQNDEICARLAVPAGVEELAALARRSAEASRAIVARRDRSLRARRLVAQRAERVRFDEVMAEVRAHLKKRELPQAIALCSDEAPRIKVASLRELLVDQAWSLDLALAARRAAVEEFKRVAAGDGRKTVRLRTKQRITGTIYDVTDKDFGIRALGGKRTVRIDELAGDYLEDTARSALASDMTPGLKLGSLLLSFGRYDDAALEARRSKNDDAGRLQKLILFASNHEAMALAAKLGARSVEPEGEGRVTLTYDFDSAKQMEQWVNAEGVGAPKWRVERGALRGGDGGVVFAPPVIGDLSVEVDCKLERGKSLAVVIDRAEKGDRDTFSALVIGYNGKVYLERWAGGRPRAVSQSVKMPAGEGRPLKIRLERRGSELSASVGGMQLLAVVKPGTGSVGLFAPEGELAVNRVSLSARLDAAWLRRSIGGEAR